MSVFASIVGSVFEELAQGDDLAHVNDAALVDAVAGWTRATATAGYHRMASMAELTHRRCTSEQAVERELWACDGWDSAAAEIAAASGISPRTAGTQMCQALALRHRFPHVAKLVADGTLAIGLAHTISWRTRLIEDPDLLARVDADLAATAATFGALSVEKVENAIDDAVLIHDPAAVLRFQTAARGCDVKFGNRDDTTGTTSMWGRLSVTDAELVQRSVDQLAASVCPHDPRSAGERRSAALAVLSVRGTELPCTCGRPDCAAPGADARADAIVIHILTDQLPDTEPPPPDPGPDSGPTPDDPPPPPERGIESGLAPNPEPEPSEHESELERGRTASGLAVIAGGGIVPTPLLAELISLGAPVRLVPGAAELCAEPHYRPSTRLQRFVRNRDLTCRLPYCDRPAERCDIDHTTPHGPGGLTHPGNMKALCRKHHLLKTFWTGPTGWTDQQLSDGTIVWISPTGHRYTRPPGSRLHFPHWDTTTPLPPGTITPPPVAGSPKRGLTMPTRKQSRAKQTAQRLHAERERNQRAIDEDVPPF
jgi:hypothetical protein